MGEFDREPFGSPREPDLSHEDAAELEELRREAAILREQLDTAAGSHGAGRSPRDIHQLEARIDSLASRNSKLMETLKEARQQLLALREEVDRLGQPPSGYGVLLSTHEDDTIDEAAFKELIRAAVAFNAANGDIFRPFPPRPRVAQRSRDRG